MVYPCVHFNKTDKKYNYFQSVQMFFVNKPVFTCLFGLN